MLIPFYEVLKFCTTDIRGILHIGAHDLEEKFDYNLHGVNNVIWIEAMFDKVDKYKNDNKIYQLVVSDTDNEDVIFHVASNGQSSSILDLGTHKNSYKDIVYVKDIPMKTTRMDTFIKRENIDIKNFNFVNLDIQGVELKALKGFGVLLEYIDYIYTEVNTQEVYINCAKVHEIDDYLSTFGFKAVKTVMTKEGWGDKFFIKSKSI